MKKGQYADLLCSLCWQPEQALEQTVELPVATGTMSWCSHDVTVMTHDLNIMATSHIVGFIFNLSANEWTDQAHDKKCQSFAVLKNHLCSEASNVKKKLVLWSHFFEFHCPFLRLHHMSWGSLKQFVSKAAKAPVKYESNSMYFLPNLISNGEINERWINNHNPWSDNPHID